MKKIELKTTIPCEKLEIRFFINAVQYKTSHNIDDFLLHFISL